MKTVILLALIMAGSLGCNGQNESKKYGSSNAGKAVKNQPQVSWKVNKEVDDKGNVVRYDSTYVWSYSRQGSSHSPQVDSVINAFKRRVDKEFNAVFRQRISQSFWNDTMNYKTYINPQ